MSDNRCPQCGKPVRVISGDYGPHAGKAKCSRCGWMKWVSKREFETMDQGEIVKKPEQNKLF